jgi:hypothetical protein
MDGRTLCGRTDVTKQKKPSKSKSEPRSAQRSDALGPVNTDRRHNRRVAVFVTLVGMIAFTSVLLLVLAPPPVTPSNWRSLFALDAPQSLDVVFQTQIPVTSNRWRYIYIHHSRTTSGDAVTLSQQSGSADHFVIGNGDGCIDGEIQMTQAWNHQQSITSPPQGASQMDPDCISICLVGDFDTTKPTPTQQRRLTQLVGTLQSKLRIPASEIQVYDLAGSPAGIGHSFPIAEFRNQILP